jgi:Flp pilus assembly protein TadG
MSCRRLYDQNGSLTVELVVITPVLFILAITILAFGRVSEARQQIVEASRASAESAALLPSASSAQQESVDAGVTGAIDSTHACAHVQVVTDVSHFYPGGYVTVTVVCQVDLSDLSVPGIPGATTIRATSTAPIDPYRSVQ